MLRYALIALVIVGIVNATMDPNYGGGNKGKKGGGKKGGGRGGKGGKGGKGGNSGGGATYPDDPTAPAADADVMQVEPDLTSIDEGTYYTVQVDGSGSKNCADYFWDVRLKDGYAGVGDGVSRSASVPAPGKYTFRLTCTHQDGRISQDKVTVKVFECKDPKYDDPDDSVTTKPPGPVTTTPPGPVTTTADPCDMIEVEAHGKMVEVTKSNGIFSVSLTASNSKNCDSFLWEKKKGPNKPGYVPLGYSEDYVYNTAHAGKYIFRITCFHDTCGNDTYEFQTDCIGSNPNPCDDMEADAVAAAKTKTKSDNTVKIYLDGSDSVDCEDMEWFVKVPGDNNYVFLSNEEELTYNAQEAGTYKFKLVCENERCEDEDTDVVEVPVEIITTVTPNPCENRHADAVAKITKTKELQYGFKVYLDASDSDDCNKVMWEVKEPGSNTWEYLSDEEIYVDKVADEGTYKYKLTCLDKKCVTDDVAYVSVDLEKTITTTTKPVDPCKGKVVKAVGNVQDVSDQRINGFFRVYLDGSGSLNCGTYTWYRAVRVGNYVEIGTGEEFTYKTAGSGKYTFKLVCEHKCGKDSDIIKTDCIYKL